MEIFFEIGEPCTKKHRFFNVFYVTFSEEIEIN